MAKWYDRGIVFVLDLFRNDGSILEYEEFMTLYNFPLPARTFNSVIKALSPSYVHLFKTHLFFNERKTILPKLLLDGVSILDKKCNSKLIKLLLHYTVYTSPRCKFFWNNFLTVFTGRKRGYSLRNIVCPIK